MAADQVVSSLTNTLMVLVLAGSLSSADLGRATLAASVLLLAIAVSRALLAEPILLRRQETELSGPSLRTGILLVAAGCTALGALTTLVSDPGTRSLMQLNLFAIPAVVTQDAVRHVLFARRKAGRALASDLIWLGSFLLALVIFGRGAPSTWTLYACWALSAWPALVVLPSAFVGSLRERPFNFDPQLRPYWSGAIYNLGVGMASNQLQILGLSLTLGLASLGAFKGAATLFGVVNLAAQAASVPVLLRLHHLAGTRRGGTESARLQTQVTVALVGLASAILITSYLLPDQIGTRLLGETWVSARSYLPAWYIFSVAGSFAFFDIQRIRALGQSSRLASFGVRLIPITVGIPLVGAHFGGVAAFAPLWAAGAVVSAVGIRRIGLHARTLADGSGSGAPTVTTVGR